MTFADAKLGEIQDGYKCIKPDDKKKGWATFKLDNSQEWTDQQRLEWETRKQQRQQALKQEELQRSIASLSPVERDREYRKLLKSLRLSSEDKNDLIRRGFTPDQINECGFKSVEQWQRLNSRLPLLLPGVLGNSLNVGQAGYLCPVRNVDGLIVGLQLRVRETDQGRYRWLTSKTRKNPSGQTPHLYFEEGEPELPLAIFRPEGKPEGISLAEGVGAKPFLVSQRLNQIVIGAAGGQFSGSPFTLESTLQCLALEGLSDNLELSERLVTIYPDAGDTFNKSVMARWKATIDLLAKLGWSVRVAWWEQFSKDSGKDIDELSDYSSIEYLSPDQFYKVKPVKKSKQPKPDKTVQQSDEEKLGWELWRKARGFTPTNTINQKYFDAPAPEKGTLTAIKSGLGSGKTHWTGETIKTIEHLQSVATLNCKVIGYRNSLLRQTCARWEGFAHLEDLENCDYTVFSKIGFCIDSIHHFLPEDFDDVCLIVDEIESVVNHLFFAHTSISRNREQAKDLFVEAINRASRVIVLDGNLSDKTVNYLESLLDNPKKIVKYENKFKIPRKINIISGKKANNRGPIIDKILQSRCCAIATDSQLEAEALDKQLSEAGKKVVRLDSKTATQDGIIQPWVSELLHDSTQFFLQNRPDAFIYTPSAESGVDISIRDYFDDCFCLFFGVITTNPQLQMMGRVRDENCNIWLHCPKKALSSHEISKSFIPEKLSKAIIDFVKADGMATLAGNGLEEIEKFTLKLIELKQDVHYEHEIKLKALTNFEREHLEECLLEALQASGCEIVKHNLTEEKNLEELKQKKEEVKTKNSEDIYQAKEITEEEAKHLESQRIKDWETQCQLNKHHLLKRLPEIDKTEQWTPELVKHVKYDDRSFIHQCEMQWLLEHPEVAKLLQENKWSGIFKNWDDRLELTKHRSNYLKVKALLELGVDWFLQPGVSWSANSPLVNEIFERCQSDQALQLALQVPIGKEKSPGAYLGKILRSLGLKSVARQEVIEGSKKRVRIYRLTHLTPGQTAALAAIERRYSNVEKPDWDGILEELQQYENTCTPPPSTDLYKQNQRGGVQLQEISETLSRTDSEQWQDIEVLIPFTGWTGGYRRSSTGVIVSPIGEKPLVRLEWRGAA